MTRDPASSQSIPRTFDSPEQEVFLNLWRTYDCLKAIEDEVLAQFEISPQQYNALRLLESSRPRPMQTLALGQKLISRNPDTTRLLDRLEKMSWIARTRPEHNRRIVEVTITQPGLSLLQRMQSAIVNMHHRQLGHLSEGQRTSLVRLLRAARRPHDDASCSWLNE